MRVNLDLSKFFKVNHPEITSIDDDKIRDLNNLIHVIKGDGIRQREFINRHLVKS